VNINETRKHLADYFHQGTPFYIFLIQFFYNFEADRPTNRCPWGRCAENLLGKAAQSATFPFHFDALLACIASALSTVN
jgi:hypothetical protein